jgi:hypothetical protein
MLRRWLTKSEALRREEVGWGGLPEVPELPKSPKLKRRNLTAAEWFCLSIPAIFGNFGGFWQS